MAGSTVAFNADSRVFIQLDKSDLVSTLDSAADAAAKWTAVETFVAEASTKEYKGVIPDFPPLKGDPNTLTGYFYGSGRQGIAYPGVKQPREITFNIQRYDRSNADHAELEDADGTAAKKLSIALVTITDGQGKTVANTAQATARCADCNLISAFPVNGPAEEEQMLQVTVGVEETSDPIDQA